MHGAHYEYYHDDGCECYVLEVWPVAFEDPQPEGGYRQDTENVVCYEFAEFEFSETIKLVSLEHLHFSQRREIFEIGWNEMGQDLELRVHLVPQEIDDSSPQKGMSWARSQNGCIGNWHRNHITSRPKHPSGVLANRCRVVLRTFGR